MKDLKIFGLKSSVVWGVFMVLIASIFAFMLASLGVEDWVKLRPDGKDEYDFKGNLIKLVDGLDSISSPFLYKNPFAKTVDVSDNIYTKVACAADFLLDTNPNGGLYPSDKTYHSWSELFDNLWLGGGVYLVFEISALVSCVIIFTTLLMFYFEIYFFNLNFCGSVCLWISHVIAILGWIGIVKPSFDGDCDEMTNGSGAPTVCALDGPKLGLFILIYSSVVMILYYVAFCVFVHNYDKRFRTTSGDITKRGMLRTGD